MEEKLTLDALLERIKSDDPDVRTAAWQAAGDVGAPAIAPLSKIVDEGELEVGRAAKRAMWQIVRTVGAPGRDECREAAESALIALLAPEAPLCVRREAFWMLSEIGRDATVEAIRDISNVVDDKDVREDARCALERIPTDFAVETLQDGLDMAPADFALAIAQSLRVRGVKVDTGRYPCKKLVPTKETSVKPVPK
jgi:HEAT repeat protein